MLYLSLLVFLDMLCVISSLGSIHVTSLRRTMEKLFFVLRHDSLGESAEQKLKVLLLELEPQSLNGDLISGVSDLLERDLLWRQQLLPVLVLFVLTDLLLADVGCHVLLLVKLFVYRLIILFKELVFLLKSPRMVWALRQLL